MISESDLTQHTRMIDAMHNVLRVLNSNRSLDEILAHIIAQPGQLLRCDAAAIYCLDQDQRFYVQASEGMDASLTIFDDSVNRRFAEQLSADPQPAVVTDCEYLLQTEAVQRDPAVLAYFQQLASHYRAYVAVPIVVRETVRGALMVYYRQPREFAPDEISLITAFSDQAALALENTWLHEQARQHAIAGERDRIARDLHDSVTQALYGIALCTEASIRHLASGDMPAAAESLHHMQGLAHDALNEMRALIYQLHSPFLAGRDLAEALRDRTHVIELQSDLRIDLRIRPEEDRLQVAPPIAEAVYRIVQEALNNVLKHSGAARVCITLEKTARCLTVAIADDGQGFDPRVQPRGFGLAHMAERAQVLGGRFEIESAPRLGTTVYVEIPL